MELPALVFVFKIPSQFSGHILFLSSSNTWSLPEQSYSSLAPGTAVPDGQLCRVELLEEAVFSILSGLVFSPLTVSSIVGSLIT